jgi:predicted RNA-binding Zn ribbon-like protein
MSEPGSTSWWFDAGSVALDFAYTGGFDDDRARVDTASELTAWLNQRFPEVGGEEAGEGDLRDALALRSGIAHLAGAAIVGESAAAEDVDLVNLFAATPDIPPILAGGSRQAGRSRARVGQALSAIARESVELFSAANAQRIRQCEADDCELIFYDDSRAGSRRWCSMQRCGNRAKVRAFRQRAAT